MRNRYLAVISFNASDDRQGFTEQAANVHGLTETIVLDNVTICFPATTPHFHHSGFIVLGAAFPVAGHAAEVDRPAANSDADRLVTTWWGDYIAVAQVRGASAVDVVRAPCGALPAYRCQHDSMIFIASDVDILLTLGVASRAIDWTFVADHLTFTHLRGARTGIADIDELFAGDVTRLSKTITTRRILWSPWEAGAAANWTENLGTNGNDLRATLISTVTALAAPFRSILLELSGGLDSSIVAACLAGRDGVTAVNLMVPDAEADERRYARLVGAHVGLPVEEFSVDKPIDLARPARIRTARPGLPAILGSVDSRLGKIATSLGTDAFFGGTGGDSAFCSLGSSAPAADAWRRLGPGMRFARTVRDVAEIYNTDVWTVAKMAIRSAQRRARQPAWPRTTEFLSGASEIPPFHPWLIEDCAPLKGTRSHIRSIMAAMAHLDGYARHVAAPSIYPLLAWPVVDACLRIPTWLWVTGGQDRAVARNAFAAQLPAAIVRRRTKGAIAAFCARTFQENRARLRPFLLDGHLAAAGLLDGATLAAYLRQTGPVADDRFYRVMALADVEAWLRAWR